jgi:tetratricopeptide (TPR) repeat protein
MKKHAAMFAFVLLMFELCVPPLFAQGAGSIKGVCKDLQGNPIAGGVLLWVNLDNDQKYTVTTNYKGEYFSPGIAVGKYSVTLYKDAGDASANKELFHVDGFTVSADESTLDFDLKKQKEISTVKKLNEKLAAAKAASDAGDYDTAIASLNAANEIDATRDLIWFKLGDAYRMSATRQTSPAEKQRCLDSAVRAYQQAVQLRRSSANDKDPNTARLLAAYYNNLAEAYARADKTDEAVKTYGLAAQTDPPAAAQYYYNSGAVLTNAGRADDAIAAFDKCIAIDPTKADAYYQKGINLIGKTTLHGDRMVAPPGTAETFRKYLELQPTGPYADVARQMLASIGAHP